MKSEAFKLMWTLLADADQWEQHDHFRIIHKKTRQGYWIANQGSFFTGCTDSFPIAPHNYVAGLTFGLLERHLLWWRFSRQTKHKLAKIEADQEMQRLKDLMFPEPK